MLQPGFSQMSRGVKKMKASLVTIRWCCDHNVLAVSTTLTQPSPQRTLNLRSFLPLASPLLPPSHCRCCSLYRCCLEGFLPHTSTAASPLPPSTDVVWHMSACPCLALLFLLPCTSLHPHLYAPSLLLHPLIFTRFCLSFHLLFLPISLPLSTPRSFLRFLAFPLHTSKLSISLLFFFLPYTIFLPPHPTSLPDVFWAEVISPAVIVKLKGVLG